MTGSANITGAVHALVAVDFSEDATIVGVTFPTRDSDGVHLGHGKGSPVQSLVALQALMLARRGFGRGTLLWFAIGVTQVHVVHGR